MFFYLGRRFIFGVLWYKVGMDWTPEDTEILQLMNRCRQVMNKVDPIGYQRFIASDKPSRGVSCNIGGFEIELWESRSRFVATIYDYREGWDDSKVLFNAYSVGAARPNYEWDKDIIRNLVIPAIDREMVLEDLSLLGE